MKRILLLALMPVTVAATFVLPGGAWDAPAMGSGASTHNATALHQQPVESPVDVLRPPPAGLRDALGEALRHAVPGAQENGLQVIEVEHAPTGIGGWHRVSGTARLGSGATAVGLRFGARFDADTGRLNGLRLRWNAPIAAPVDGPARSAVERAVGRALAAEFPMQSPRFELLVIARESSIDAGPSGSSHRLFRGRGRIDFGSEGEVLAPIEVVMDENATVVALRYSLDQLDPAPFDGATSLASR